MNQKTTVTTSQHGIKFSTGTLAGLANGSVTVQLGETIVFVATAAASTIREGQDFFPLTVDYREKFSAAGRFPGGYFKREGRPTEKEILTSRLCDRPCRPLFPKGFLNEVQVIGMLLATDLANEPDVLMVNGASAALAISDIPWNGPIGCVRVGQIDGQFVANPTIEQMYSSNLDLIYVGTETEMLMIEGSGDQIPEARFLEALEFGQQAIQPIISAIKELAAQHGKPKKEFALVKCDEKVFAIVDRVARARVTEAVKAKSKQERQAGIATVTDEAKAAVLAELGEGNFNPNHIKMAFEELQEDAYRGLILNQGYRSGGRPTNALRELSCSVGVLPRVHGSAIFQRGETQALVTATLGSNSESQDLDGLTGGPKSKSFVLHYNFPPYSVGETGRYGGTGRREIGHGALAERSLLPVVPTEEDFPYCIRIVSDIMSSNGSTSMASICGGCLSLMDAGVPIIAPVAGISVGLVSERDASGAMSKYVTLTDILGEEDHFGDMDFKIAGTAEGITGFQLDLKINGLPFEIVRKAVAESREARLQILAAMTATIGEPRKELSQHAPRIETVQIDPEKIGALIGPGGKNIRRIVEITGAQIDIDESNNGKVYVYTSNMDAMRRAVAEVTAVGGKIEEGKIYRGVVRGIKEFGCFVEVLPGQEGLVHISELADFRVRRTEDVCKMGDEMVVKCVGIDEKGRVRLSRKAALAELEAKEKGQAAPAAETPAAD
ncbi:polyribonucleotide nucleotidyltransferase [Opitutales bacterium ASA1]|uniref:polyribonucleotide nucleotidyltransferase n=1 Tax=Congregicoccus parvus TaxID=3081749 RepID=UPI002B2ED4F8|nr:polyribonucleotide nucleotidyltransferase [Opitutales bacterium ASA1]